MQSLKEHKKVLYVWQKIKLTMRISSSMWVWKESAAQTALWAQAGALDFVIVSLWTPCGHSWSDIQVSHRTAEVRASPLISLQLLCSWSPILQPFTSQNKQSPLSEVFCFLEIVGSIRLEKTFKVTNHNYQLSTMFSTKLCPQLSIFMISEQSLEWWLCHKSVGARRRRWTGQEWKAAPKCWEALRKKTLSLCAPKGQQEVWKRKLKFPMIYFFPSLCLVLFSCLVLFVGGWCLQEEWWNSTMRGLSLSSTRSQWFGQGYFQIPKRHLI